MNEANLLRWIEALESGRYTQMKKLLRSDRPDGTCFCAAGVLIEVAIEAGVPVLWDRERQEYTFQATSWTGSTFPASTQTWLPFTVKDWLGSSFEPMVNEAERIGVMTANDEQGLTFAQIAAALRSQYFPETLK